MINLFLKLRYFYYRNFKSYNLKNYSNKNKKGYLLTFEDDFNEVSWEGPNKKWIIGEHWGEYHPKRPFVYFDKPKLGNNSTAIFEVKYNPKVINGITLPFSASWLSTHGLFTQQYGRFECRMTLPHMKASWPAFWTYGPTWPPEIDTIEAYGDSRIQEINIHYQVPGQHKKSIGAKKFRTYLFEDQFNEYAVEWEPNEIRFYTDNVLIYVCRDKNILDTMNGEQHVLVNNNIQPRFLKQEEYYSYYSSFKVDYVRVYKF